jgi:hypothetical protein
MLIGAVGVLFSLGSCFHPARDERTSVYDDADSNGGPYITGQQFAVGMLVGVTGFTVGAYLHGLAKHTNK